MQAGDQSSNLLQNNRSTRRGKPLTQPRPDWQTVRLRDRIQASQTWSFAAGIVIGAFVSSLSFLAALAWLIL